MLSDYSELEAASFQVKPALARLARETRASASAILRMDAMSLQEALSSGALPFMLSRWSVALGIGDPPSYFFCP